MRWLLNILLIILGAEALLLGIFLLKINTQPGMDLRSEISTVVACLNITGVAVFIIVLLGRMQRKQE